MTHPADDGYAHAVIETVRELTALVEEHKRSGEDGRAQLLSRVEGVVAAMRQDVHKAIASVQMTIVEDKSERTRRQQQVDQQLTEIRRWLIGALIGIGLIGGILIGRVVF